MKLVNILFIRTDYGIRLHVLEALMRKFQLCEKLKTTKQMSCFPKAVMGETFLQALTHATVMRKL